MTGANKSQHALWDSATWDIDSQVIHKMQLAEFQNCLLVLFVTQLWSPAPLASMSKRHPTLSTFNSGARNKGVGLWFWGKHPRCIQIKTQTLPPPLSSLDPEKEGEMLLEAPMVEPRTANDCPPHIFISCTRAGRESMGGGGGSLTIFNWETPNTTTHFLFSFWTGKGGVGYACAMSQCATWCLCSGQPTPAFFTPLELDRRWGLSHNS